MSRGCRIALISLLVLFAPAVVAKADSQPALLSAVERKMAAQVDAEFSSQLAFLQRIVDINSETMNFDGVEAVGRIFVAELQALGFEARWEDQRAALKRAGHVVATRRGVRGKRILMIGHLDTVHPPDSPFNRFVRVDYNRATGPGAEDMKNGAAVMLFAMKALHATGRLEGRDIAIVLTGDEEAPPADTGAARKSLIDAATGRDVVLSFEAGEPGVVVTSRRGFTGWQLAVSGKQAHSGSIFSPETGAGAILEASRILDSFRAELLVEPSLTFNVGGVLGGTEASFDFGSGRGKVLGKQNVVSKIAVAWGEFRPLTVAQAERTQARMTAIAGRNLPQTGAEIRFTPGYAPMEAKAGNMKLQREISAISEALGAGPLAPNDPVSRGAGDISFVANMVPAALDGLGGAGGGAHSMDEWVDLGSFRASTKRAAILLDRLGQP